MATVLPGRSGSRLGRGLRRRARRRPEALRRRALWRRHGFDAGPADPVADRLRPGRAGPRAAPFGRPARRPHLRHPAPSAMARSASRRSGARSRPSTRRPGPISPAATACRCPGWRWGGGWSAWPTAAIDISDGLAADLGHICATSGVGGVVEAARVPLSDAARQALAADPGLLDDVLGGGDDYELLFTAPAGGGRPAGPAWPGTWSCRSPRSAGSRPGPGFGVIDETGRDRDPEKRWIPPFLRRLRLLHSPGSHLRPIAR